MNEEPVNQGMEKKSILQMAGGAFLEIADREMAAVTENILDVNTKATFKRKITITLEFVPDEVRQNIAVSFITLEFVPDEVRQNIAVSFNCTSKLAPVRPVTTWLNAYNPGHIVEMLPAVPGQMDMDGYEHPKPPVLRLVVNE